MVALLVSEGVASPQHQKLVRGFSLDSAFVCAYVYVLVLVCVCACVCACDIVRACAYVSVCGMCVRVCVVKSWRAGLRSMCVCVCGDVKPCGLESTPGRKRERTPSREPHKIKPTAAARHPWLGFCAPYKIPISIR